MFTMFDEVSKQNYLLDQNFVHIINHHVLFYYLLVKISTKKQNKKSFLLFYIFERSKDKWLT